MITLPNFLIVGASKSGTTSLYHYLKQHPDIFLSDIQKEGRYFSKMEGNYQGPGDSNVDSSIIRNLTDYKNLFANWNRENAVGDISPEYLYFHKKAIPQIKKDLGEAVKIIIILRSPLDRAFSGYMHFKRDQRETLTFEEGMEMEQQRMEKNWIWAWQYKESGLYFEQVKAYFDNFKNIKIINFDDFQNDSRTVLKELSSFLKVDPDFEFDTNYKYNVSGAPKSKVLYKLETSRGLIKAIKKIIPQKLAQILKNRFTGEEQMVKQTMNPETKDKLINFFKDDILKLQNLIQQDLSGWLK